MLCSITGEQMTALVASSIDSASKVAQYLNSLHPERPQTGCVIRLGYHDPASTSVQRYDAIVLPAGLPMSSSERETYTDLSYEKINRMFTRDAHSSWSTRDPSKGQWGGAIALSLPRCGIAVSGWWEEYDVLHAVWIGRTNGLLSSEAAERLINEVDSYTFGAGSSAYHHLNPRLNREVPSPGWVRRYFGDQANHTPPRHRT